MSNPFTVGQTVRATAAKVRSSDFVPFAEVGAEFTVVEVIGPHHVKLEGPFRENGDVNLRKLDVHIDWLEAVEPKLAVGDKVATAEQWDSLPMGAVCTDGDGWTHTKISNTTVSEDGSRPAVAVTIDPKSDDERDMAFAQPWNWGTTLTSLGTEDGPEKAPGRPTIDFGGKSRRTAREYAEHILAVAKLVKSKGILEDVANGYVVDAYALNAALTAALRAGLNKGRNAAERKDFGREVAYLAHITQAVLENHADELPAYVEGQRSRKVQGLEAELAVERAAFEAAKRNYDNSQRDLDALRARAQEDIARLEREKLALSISLSKREAELVDEQDIGQSVAMTLEYARALLAAADEHAASQVAGYMDAHGLILNNV